MHRNRANRSHRTDRDTSPDNMRGQRRPVGFPGPVGSDAGPRRERLILKILELAHCFAERLEKEEPLHRHVRRSKRVHSQGVRRRVPRAGVSEPQTGFSAMPLGEILLESLWPAKQAHHDIVRKEWPEAAAEDHERH